MKRAAQRCAAEDSSAPPSPAAGEIGLLTDADVEVTRPCTPESVSDVRTWVAAELESRRPGVDVDLVEDVRLVVSELVTNAVRAEASAVTVRLQLRPDAVLLGVEDDARGLPRERHASHTDVNGRGLTIVGMLAHEWGVRPTSVGKQVWAVLSLH